MMIMMTKLYMVGKGSFISPMVFFSHLRLIKQFQHFAQHSYYIACTNCTIFLCNLFFVHS